MEDETGALNSKRNMVDRYREEEAAISPSKRGKNGGNHLTRSQALPNSSTKDGSGDRSNRSNGGGAGGLLGLSGINLDFRKSGNGIRSFFQKSGSNNHNNHGDGGVSKSI